MHDLAADGWQLVRRNVVFTSLESSVDALTAGMARPQEKFEDQLCRKLRKINPDHPALAARQELKIPQMRRS